LRGMPTAARLLAHLSASALFAWYVLSPMAVLELTLIVLAVAWLTNLYNFMDGSDGLAGGMSLIGFGACGAAAYLAGHAALASLGIALAAASAAFLTHNFHPARIFLGDVGSIPLGFLAGAVGILGWREDVWPLWFPVLVFGPFIGDATATLVKRLIRGERVWHAHREHYYQRMVRMGLGHRNTAWIAYGAMIGCAIAALLGRTAAPEMQAAAFIGGSTLLAVLAVAVDFYWARFIRRTERAA
jgi:UDP-N-acetylmuramyl pentapeptide phosphotransferase/UDP-N-acetylglucosamine-1-phosphate transferase